MKFWRLTEDGVEPCTPEEWDRRATADPNRRVAHDIFSGVTISTMFTGLNTQSDPLGPPLLYQTVVFGKSPAQEISYATREEAAIGHARLVERFRPRVEVDGNR